MIVLEFGFEEIRLVSVWIYPWLLHVKAFFFFFSWKLQQIDVWSVFWYLLKAQRTPVIYF